MKENKNTIHFQQRLLLNCLLHDLEIVTMNGGESTNQYHTPLTVAKFTGMQKKFKSNYFIATPRMFVHHSSSTVLSENTIKHSTITGQQTTATTPAKGKETAI
jgi:hypothetical protein